MRIAVCVICFLVFTHNITNGQAAYSPDIHEDRMAVNHEANNPGIHEANSPDIHEDRMALSHEANNPGIHEANNPGIHQANIPDIHQTHVKQRQLSKERRCRPVLKRLQLSQLAEEFSLQSGSDSAWPNDFDLRRCEGKCTSSSSAERVCLPLQIANKTLRTRIGQNFYHFQVEEHLQCTCVRNDSGPGASQTRASGGGSPHVVSQENTTTQPNPVKEAPSGVGVRDATRSLVLLEFAIVLLYGRA